MALSSIIDFINSIQSIFAKKGLDTLNYQKYMSKKKKKKNEHCNIMILKHTEYSHS